MPAKYTIRVVSLDLYVAPNRHYEANRAHAIKFDFRTFALVYAIFDLDLDPNTIAIDPIDEPETRS